jgi:hypothetical protein
MDKEYRVLTDSCTRGVSCAHRLVQSMALLLTCSMPMVCQEVAQLEEKERVAWSEREALQLLVELPAFPHSVLYQQPAVSAPSMMGGSKKEGPSTMERVAPDGSLIAVHDPEVGVMQDTAWW